MGPGLTQYTGPYGAMGAITGLPNAVAPAMGLHRDPRTLSKQPSELVNPVQVPDHSTNKDQGVRNGNCFCYQPGHVLDCNNTLSYALHDLSFVLVMQNIFISFNPVSSCCFGMLFVLIM